MAIENPGDHLPRDVFRNQGFNINPIDVDSNGIKLNVLKASHSTAVYITPSHQMPLGHVMPVANRLKLISWPKEVDGIRLLLGFGGVTIDTPQGIKLLSQHID